MGELVEVRVPDIGDFDEVDVVEVLVAPGQTIAVDDSLITLESDKASMEVPSTVAGVVREVRVAVGDQVGEGAVIVVVEAGDASSDAAASAPGEAAPQAGKGAEAPAPEETAAAPAERRPAPPEPPAAATEESPSESPARRPPPPEPPGAEKASEVTHASPSVRRFARTLGADLTLVAGTGRKGRILRSDVEAFVKRALTSGAGAAPAAASGSLIPDMPRVDFAKYGEIEIQPMSRIQRLSARNVHRSWLHVPHVTQHDEADITEMEVFRQAESPRAKELGFKLTPLVFLMKAVVQCLKQYPRLNASLHEDGESLVLKKYFHLGIAVDTEEGLVVPVVRDVDRKSLFELARELHEVSARAREGKMRLDDLQGACFSISSLGGIGGSFFTPIVNAPEVAVLGVSRSQWRQVYRDGDFEARLVLPLSLSYDHRVIDGAMAARFTTLLAHLLGDVRRLLL